jgi:hypothetical protein
MYKLANIALEGIIASARVIALFYLGYRWLCPQSKYNPVTNITEHFNCLALNMRKQKSQPIVEKYEEEDDEDKDN